MDNHKKEKLINAVAALIILYGVAIRLSVYWKNRAVGLDEANVIRNIAERGYAGFFESLDYGQYVPPLVAVAFKACADVFGLHEYAFRLVPLLVGCASLYLFWRLCGKFMEERAGMLLMVWVLACNYNMIHYAEETKQYGVDPLITMVLLWYAHGVGKAAFTLRETLFWMSLGGGLIWCSMPSVFVLAGVGLCILHRKWDTLRSDPKYMLPFFAIGLVWLCSFAVYYCSILRADMAFVPLQQYHSDYFPPLFPTDAESLAEARFIIDNVLYGILGYGSSVRLCFGIFGLLVGPVLLWRSDKGWFFLFVAPFLLCWVASGLGFYSLIPRLTTFLLPIALLLIGIAWDWVASKVRKAPAWVAVLFGLTLSYVAYLQDGREYLWKGITQNELKPVLEELANEIEAGETVYVHFAAVAAYDVYTRKHIHKDSKYALSQYPTIYTDWDDDRPHPRIDKGLPFPERIWLVVSHEYQNSFDNTKRDLEGRYRLVSKIEGVQAGAFLFELRPEFLPE